LALSPVGLQSGGRVRVQYGEQDFPMADIQRLDGGCGRHVLVASLQPGGLAELAGVQPGHALVGINGGEDFRRRPGWQVRLLLVTTPMTLLFDLAPLSEEPLDADREEQENMKFCERHEKHFAEGDRRPLGIPSFKSVCGPSDLVGDLVVFCQGPTPLMLYSATPDSEQAFKNYSSSLRSCTAGGAYELRRDEAYKLVAHSLRGALAEVSEVSASNCSGKLEAISSRPLSKYRRCDLTGAGSPTRPSVPTEGLHRACLLSSFTCGLRESESQATQTLACGRSFAVCSAPGVYRTKSSTGDSRREISRTYL